jgi:hypothetical protein
METQTPNLQAPDFEGEDLSRFEAHETSRKLPAGWLLLFWGLVLWGLWYAWSYLPVFSGWTAAQDLDAAPTSAGASIFATILFTAVATIVAVSILFTVARRRKA